MIKAFLALAFTLFANPAWSGLPPTTIQGQSDAGPKTKFSFQVPYNQFTDMGGIKALVETGNKNLLPNASFENTSYASGWTITTASGSVETTVVEDGKQSAKLTFSASTGDIAQSVTPSIQVNSKNMEASCWVNTTLSTIQVCAIVGGTETNCQAAPSSGNWSQVSASFVGPGSGSVGVRVKTTASTTGSVYVDDCYVGPNRAIGAGYMASDFSQSYPVTFSNVGTIGTNSLWSARLGDTMAFRGTFVAGSPSAAPFKINMPTGITIDSSKYGTQANTQIVGTLWRETAPVNTYAGPNGGPYPLLYDGSTTNGIFVSNGTSGSAIAPSNASGVFAAGDVVSYYFEVPVLGWTSSQAGYRADVTPGSWSGYHTVSGGWSATSTVFVDPTAGTSPALTQTTTRNITCSTTGSSGAGIDCVLPRSGNYSVSARVQGSTGASETYCAQLVDGAGTVLDKGTCQTTPGANYVSIPIRGAYTASTSGTFTFKVRLSSKGGTSISITNAGGTGSSAIQWEVVELDAPMPAPYLTGSVTSTTTGAEHIERATITNSGAPAIASQSGSWISSVSLPATGDVTLNFASGEFSSAPSCTCSVSGTFGYICSIITAATTSAVTIDIASFSGSKSNQNFAINCMGPR